MKKLFSLIICNIVLQVCHCFAQNATNDKNIIPPSPNVASLLKYSQIPVSKYTGIPNINIPLYTIKEGGIEMPISLSYHASGIKVGEDASWVGLGWSLNAGGVIGRSIRGADDLSANVNGYWQGTFTPVDSYTEKWISTASVDPAYSNYKHTYNGEWDAEPDLFFFNFLDFSGKFMLNKQDGSSGWLSATMIDQKSNLRIKVKTDGSQWVVVDGNGVKYYFATPEYSYGESDLSSVAQSSGYNRPVYGTYYEDTRTTSAWYLDSVVTSQGDKITLSYTLPANDGGVVSATNTTSAYYKFLSQSTTNFTNYSGFGDFTFYNYSKTITQEAVLAAISFHGGHIDFNTGGRLDIETTGGYSAKKLGNMAVTRQGEESPFKSADFKYDYFSGNRLRLDTLHIDDRVYVFTYDSSTLPDKNTYSIDHWGFYNGKSNLTLIPRTPYNTEELMYTGGADRETNPAYVQLGMLTSIKYPTGGTASFLWEPNDVDETQPIYTSGGGTQEASFHYYEVTNEGPVAQYDFYVSADPLHPGQNVNIDFTANSSTNKNCSQLGFMSGDPFAVLVAVPDSAAAVYSNVEDYISNPNSQSISVVDIIDYAACANNTIAISEQHTYSVAPGWYRMVVQAPEYFVSATSVSYKKFLGYTNYRTVGGARIRQITDSGITGPGSFTKYVYRRSANPERSSGLLLSAPIYTADTDIKAEETTSSPSTEETIYRGIDVSYRITKSSSLKALSSAAQGGFVGYDEVTEVFGENGENGKTTTTFTNTAYSTGNSTPPVEIIGNGQPLTEITFKATGDTLRKVQNVYLEQYTVQKTLPALATETYPFLANIAYHYINGTEPTTVQISPFYLNHYYEVHCRWLPLHSTTITNYAANSKIIDSSIYSYDLSNRQIATRIDGKSDGTKLVSKYKYATDYNSTAGGIFISMAANNIVNPPIEFQQWHRTGSTDSLLASTVTEYKYYAGDKFISPYKTYRLRVQKPIASGTVGETASSTGPFSNLFFNGSLYDVKQELDYDAYGNPVKIRIDNLSDKSYKWGYQQQYPIAECKNASNTEFYTENYEEASGATGAAHTGNKYSTNASVSWTRPNSRTYIIDYWYLDGTIWKYKQDNYSTNSYIMTGGSGYDDVRIYPKDAQITTYTYDPLIGMTSATDTKGQTTYYEYDSFQRLVNIKDQYGNIVKHTDYHYQNQ